MQITIQKAIIITYKCWKLDFNISTEKAIKITYTVKGLSTY